VARRRHRRAHHRTHDGVMSKLSKFVVPATFAVSAVGQLTAKDIAAYPSYDTLPNIEKGKFLLNAVLGRTTSFNPYPQYGTPKFTVNPAGALNKYTGTGIGLMILSAVLPKGVGGKGIAKKVGKGLFWGGIVGGFFDAPKNGTIGIATSGSYVNYSQLTGRNQGGGTLP
jgi:hypothetical protein